MDDEFGLLPDQQGAPPPPRRPMGLVLGGLVLVALASMAAVFWLVASLADRGRTVTAAGTPSPAAATTAAPSPTPVATTAPATTVPPTTVAPVTAGPVRPAATTPSPDRAEADARADHPAGAAPDRVSRSARWSGCRTWSGCGCSRPAPCCGRPVSGSR